MVSCLRRLGGVFISIYGDRQSYTPVVKLSPANMDLARAPAFCDESGVGFGPLGGEFNAAFVKPYSLASDETWLPEWSRNLGAV